MSSEESTPASTHALCRACAANNCHRKNPFTTTFYCYATTFNMNAAKSQQKSHFRLHNKNCQSTTPVTTSHLKQLRFVIADRAYEFSNEMHQWCRTESCFGLNWPSSGKINSSVMRSSLTSVKLTGSICGKVRVRLASSRQIASCYVL